MTANTVEYRVFLSDTVLKEGGSHEGFLSTCLAFLSPLIRDYIWQKEPFVLRANYEDEQKGELPPCLCGRTDFGDNVEDEWFIVFLLFELSKRFPEVCVSIHDNDGEFLLIEVAHFLPKWLQPETSENRVFVHGGSLHIVPIPTTPGEVTLLPIGTPSVCQAVKLVFSDLKTTASQKVQYTLQGRIRGYPEKALQFFHHANCYVPVAVKHVLEQKPGLISPAVQAFYERDPVDMKAFRTMKYFPPDNRLMARVCFTKCLYAQLMQQNFAPEFRSGWSLPATSSPLHKAYSMGMKLACGFEILCSRSSGVIGNFEEETEPSGLKWEQFVGCLREQGYFKGKLEGSKFYKEMLERAKQHFRASFSTSEKSRTDPGSVILSLIKDKTFDEMNNENAEDLPPEDDDQWLEISPQDVDDILTSYKSPANSGGDRNSGKEMFDLESVTHSMKSFVDKVSSHEGAEFPWTADDADIQFNADSFMDTMQKVLEARPADSESDGEDDGDLSISSSEEEPEEQTDEDEAMKSYMEQMDRELAGTVMGQTFEKNQAVSTQEQTATEKENSPKSKDTNSNTDEQDVQGQGTDEMAPVNVDLNLVKNILESFTMQQGLAGPASNILQSMGVELPQNADVI